MEELPPTTTCPLRGGAKRAPSGLTGARLRGEAKGPGGRWLLARPKRVDPLRRDRYGRLNHTEGNLSCTEDSKAFFIELPDPRHRGSSTRPGYPRKPPGFQSHRLPLDRYRGSCYPMVKCNSLVINYVDKSSPGPGLEVGALWRPCESRWRDHPKLRKLGINIKIYMYLCRSISERGAEP